MPIIFSGRTVFSVPQSVSGLFHDNVALRDTILDTTTISFNKYNKAVIDMVSDLDENITIKVYGSRDGTKFYQLGSDIILTSGGSDNYETLTEVWDYIKVTAQAGSNPTSGNYTIGYQFLG